MSNSLTGANLQEKLKQDKKKEPEQEKTYKKSSLLNLQQNLVQSLNTLRYMNSREAKIKILYSLNYFRSIQKRLMMDLREFGTRERMLGDVVDPLIPADEADGQLVDTYNMVLSNTNKIMNLTEKYGDEEKKKKLSK